MQPPRPRALLTALLCLTALVSVTAIVAPNSVGATETETATTDPIVSVHPGRSTCALYQSGQIQCWGYNDDNGQLGDGTRNNSSVPVNVFGVSNATSVNPDNWARCVLLSNGTVKCWGVGVVSDTAVTIPGITTATAVTRSCALLTDRTVQCWGYPYGSPDTTVPTAIATIDDAISISTGSAHSCALLASGSIKCWGQNNYGQLGDGTFVTSTDAVSVQGIDDAVAVTSGDRHTCAILDTGAVKCWGRNDEGQAGNGTFSDIPLPLEVQGVSNATELSMTFSRTCALLETGAIKCWGRNRNGGLGNGSLTNSPVAVDVQGIETATAVSIGYTGGCALLDTGAITCWGLNDHGRLGNGTTTSSTMPVAVQGISNATSVATSWGSTCAVLETNKVKCWGANDVGQLGNGTTTSTTVPVTALINVEAHFVSPSASATSGWVIIDDGRSHVSSDCRAQLEALGRTFAVSPWEDVIAVPKRATVPCDILAGIPPSNTGTPEPPEPPEPPVPGGAALVTNSASNSAGWAVVDGNRQWLNATCRTQLENAGATFAIEPWSVISASPNTTSPRSCDALETLIGGTPTTPPEGNVAFVTNNATNDAGWAIVDGTRQWLNAPCRIQLEAAGATFAITTWSDISASPRTASLQSCDALEALIGGGTGNDGELFQTTVNVNGGFWVENGERKWLNNACMDQLRAAGATVTAVPWSEIAPTTDNPALTTCAEILADL